MTITTLAVAPTIESSEHDAPLPAAHTTGWRISPFRSSGQAPTPRHEKRFVGQLAVHRSDGEAPEAPRRAAITVLATALRSGTSLAQVLTVARGLTAADLLVAHDHVEALRSDALAAFDELVSDPTAARFLEIEDRLGSLFPALASTFRELVPASPAAFAACVAAADDEARTVEFEIDEINRRLDEGGADVASLLGLLDDGGNSGLHHHRCHRPTRLGDIVPSRLAHLLRESEEAES